MNNAAVVTNIVLVCGLFAITSCSVQEEKAAKPATLAAPAPAAKAETKAPAEKAPEKAKAEKASGDIGLMETEKNYMIVVTKDGKLVTIDYNQKTKVTELQEKPAKMADIGLGSAATVEYTKKGDKNFISKIEFAPAKGGD